MKLEVTDHLAWESLQTYLAENAGIEDVSSIRQFTGGAANLTYRIDAATGPVVLRRPPFGRIGKGAHDMAREFRVLSALRPVFDECPRALHLCEEEDVVGAPFVILELVEGSPVVDNVPSELPAGTLPAELAELAFATLGRLHSLDAVGNSAIAALGRPDGFVHRQIVGWRGRWEAVQIPHLAELATEVVEALDHDIPTAQRVSVIHNDFKLDNCMFGHRPPLTLNAILDWDMATLGDPLLDLAQALEYWPDPSDSPEDHAIHPPGLERLDLPDRAAMASLYAANSGLDLERLAWYRSLAAFKTAVVLAQFHERFMSKASTDPKLRDRLPQIEMLLHRSARLLRGRR